MTKAQLIAAIKTTYDSVSNNASLTSEQARAKISTDIGTAIDVFISDKVPNDQSGKIDQMKNLIILLVKELLKQRIDVGRNVDFDQLNTIIDDLEKI